MGINRSEVDNIQVFLHHQRESNIFHGKKHISAKAVLCLEVELNILIPTAPPSSVPPPALTSAVFHQISKQINSPFSNFFSLANKKTVLSCTLGCHVITKQILTQEKYVVNVISDHRTPCKPKNWSIWMLVCSHRWFRAYFLLSITYICAESQ